MFDVFKWWRGARGGDFGGFPKRGEITLSGPARHGKTAFADTLLIGLKRLGYVWPHWRCEMSPQVEERLRRTAEELGKRRVPRAGGLAPVSDSAGLAGLPRWGDRPLVLTESRGHFSRANRLPAQVLSPVEIIFISPAEARGNVLEGLDGLVAKCLWPSGSARRPRLRSSKILVLSQADRCLWPVDIQGHLLGDPLRSLWTNVQHSDESVAAPLPGVGRGGFAIDEYLQRMAAQDARLKQWLASTRDGAAALQHFAAAGVDLRVCAVSAFGSRPIDDKLLCPWRPSCVFDPLFWAFEMTSASR